ncbi:hypothetical protein D3C71_1826720 [compost metagenome]
MTKVNWIYSLITAAIKTAQHNFKALTQAMDQTHHQAISWVITLQSKLMLVLILLKILKTQFSTVQLPWQQALHIAGINMSK